MALKGKTKTKGQTAVTPKTRRNGRLSAVLTKKGESDQNMITPGSANERRTSARKGKRNWVGARG